MINALTQLTDINDITAKAYMVSVLSAAREQNASDIAVGARHGITFRIKGRWERFRSSELTKEQLELVIKYIVPPHQQAEYQQNRQLDFAYMMPELGRFRFNAYTERSQPALVVRVIADAIPEFSTLQLPPQLLRLVQERQGLILVTGPTGSGKSTTLASLLVEAKKQMSGHIITLEDPIEYYHEDSPANDGGYSFFSQRETGIDGQSYDDMLKAALRQQPRIILIGEIRSAEVAEVALNASETGHLVLATMHTRDTASTVDRMISLFPEGKQGAVANQLSNSLKAALCQQLVPNYDGDGMVLAYELMITTTPIANEIRMQRTHAISDHIMQNRDKGMIRMDDSLEHLYNNASITAETLLIKATDPKRFKKGRL
jgi:twitching motility protein PilT